MKTLAIALILVSLLALGCVAPPQAQNATNATQPPSTPPPKAPSFSILTPEDQEAITATGDTTDVSVTFSTQNLVLKRPGGAAKTGEGYFKLTLDNGQSAIVTSKSYVITGLSAGQHVVEVELMNNDGTSYSPRLDKRVIFTIESAKPVQYIPKTYTVTIHDFAYDPAQITVKLGDSVIFANTGSYPRSATCFIGGKQVFDTMVLGPGQNATITFTDMLDCEYYSTTYRAMTGRISVESNETG
jgi:plastocyanin